MDGDSVPTKKKRERKNLVTFSPDKKGITALDTLMDRNEWQLEAFESENNNKKVLYAYIGGL
jgi:hypothetical protein